jgi:hypothetical protein
MTNNGGRIFIIGLGLIVIDFSFISGALTDKSNKENPFSLVYFFLIK